MKARAIAATLFALAISVMGDAHAETPPSRWDRAKDDDAETRFELHVAAMRMLHSMSSTGTPREANAYRVVQILLQNHVDQMPDVTLRIDLGIAFAESGRHELAVQTLSQAIAMDPSHPARSQALYVLALSYAHLDRSEQELATYERYLNVEVDPEARASTILNMAEARMRLGDLRAAIDGYRDAIRIAEDIRTQNGVQSYVLAIWGLCVALDRNGDETGALIEAKRAASHDPYLALISIADNVFFVPEYERYYYQGMGELALAASAATEREKVEHFDKAERRFGNYVQSAAENDRWVTRAKSHLKFAESKTKMKERLIVRPQAQELKL